MKPGRTSVFTGGNLGTLFGEHDPVEFTPGPGQKRTYWIVAAVNDDANVLTVRPMTWRERWRHRATILALRVRQSLQWVVRALRGSASS